MSSLFRPKTPAVAPGPSALPKPRVMRMPTETDPTVLAAADRTRKAALMRKGRQSTILTDTLNSTIGSGGEKLGA